MNKETIEAGNKLIAKFMGWKFQSKTEHPHVFPNGIWYKAGSIGVAPPLQFHCSWDELMGVIDKIESMDCHFSIGTNKVTCQADGFSGSSRIGYGYNKLLIVWEVVVQFINHYNTQQQNQ